MGTKSNDTDKKKKHSLTKGATKEVGRSKTIFDEALEEMSQEDRADLIRKAGDVALELQKDATERDIKSSTAERDIQNFTNEFNRIQTDSKLGYVSKKGKYETGSGNVEIHAKKSKCFVATTVYGDERSFQVVTLKKFRDDNLRNNFLGRYFVSFYYRVGPTLAAVVGRVTFLRVLAKCILDLCVKVISNRSKLKIERYNLQVPKE